ncbi:MAG: hypothetical protein OXG35_03620 [Acidobacteria bacterium]|nr:hypothetical protein [Acidobacteriota bacterium]
MSLSLALARGVGIWVASPLINIGGIPIEGLAIAVSLDDIADTVIGGDQDGVSGPSGARTGTASSS